jgi:hypothetical protein
MKIQRRSFGKVPERVRIRSFVFTGSPRDFSASGEHPCRSSGAVEDLGDEPDNVIIEITFPIEHWVKLPEKSVPLSGGTLRMASRPDLILDVFLDGFGAFLDSVTGGFNVLADAFDGVARSQKHGGKRHGGNGEFDLHCSLLC